MQKINDSPKITSELLKLYDKDTLTLIQSTFYRRGADGCNMSFAQYVKTLKEAGFTPGMRIIRIDKNKIWSKDNMMLTNDPMHKKLVDITSFYIKNGNPKPKKVIIKRKERVINE